MQIIAGDIGGTNARFAVAELTEGQRPRLLDMFKCATAGHSDLASAWREFAKTRSQPLPRAASIAVASPLGGDLLRFTNSHWTIDPRQARAELGLEELHFLNDFGAAAHGVSLLGPDELAHLHGPEHPDRAPRVTSVIGPGTGLGVALIARQSGSVQVVETEGGHVAFAPQDVEEERIARALSGRHGRCSVERIVSGPGLLDIYGAKGGDPERGAAELWAAATSGSDGIARESLELLVRAFGSVAGDLALAHGAQEVVISSGLSRRIRPLLESAAFRDRFVDKGRYRELMGRIPIRLALADEPGLLGAAVAFQRRLGWELPPS